MTGLLLDTHVMLWWLVDEPLASDAAEAIADPEQRVVLSVASAWEVAIKQGRGRLEIAEDYLDVLRQQEIELLGITPQHTRVVRDLPDHHRDPFDRMLVAQARVEGLTLVTRDRRLADYDVGILPA